MKKMIGLTAVVTAFIMTVPAEASGLLDVYGRQARQENPGFTEFSAQRGEAFYREVHKTGKAETPSCTSCHTTSPARAGLTRAGKTIAPMAVSVSPDRYTNERKVEKWFRRNCNSVLGRTCSATEKGDFITFMLTQ